LPIVIFIMLIFPNIVFTAWLDRADVGYMNTLSPNSVNSNPT
ncbi:unnamed protein product, partial [marine sediment metagenome]